MESTLARSATYKKAIRVIDDNVAPRRVAEVYIGSELRRLFGWSATRLNKEMAHIKKLSKEDIFRLLEAFSFTYRHDGVFYRAAHDKFLWVEVELLIDEIVLTGINPKAVEMIKGEAVQRRPRAFAEYLQRYFKDHKETDYDSVVVELMPRATLKELADDTIMAQEKDGEIRMFDGSHRLLAMAQQGATRVRAFVAIEKAGSASLQMRGSAIFLHLRQLFERTEGEGMRQEIIDVTRELVRTSKDGRRAIQRYWIENGLIEQVKQAGREILSE